MIFRSQAGARRRSTFHKVIVTGVARMESLASRVCSYHVLLVGQAIAASDSILEPLHLLTGDSGLGRGTTALFVSMKHERWLAFDLRVDITGPLKIILVLDGHFAKN